MNGPNITYSLIIGAVIWCCAAGACAGGSGDDVGDCRLSIAEDSVVNLIQWSESEGGNGHWYAILPELMVWDWADSVAHLLIWDGRPGYLATVTSIEENAFIVDYVIGDIVNTTFYDEYCLGGVYHDSIWSWITGEPFDYTNWAPNQPASYFQSGILMMWGNGSEVYGQPGEWEIWYNHHGDFWSIIEWGDVEDTGSMAVNDEDDYPMPRGFSLAQNYPNPFNPSTTIEFTLEKRNYITLDIYDVTGRAVVQLFSGFKMAGRHRVQWNGKGADGDKKPSGMYFYKLTVDGMLQSRTMLLLK